MYQELWWAELATGFPSIIIVTNKSAKRLSERIAKENTAGLNFIVYDLDYIKEVCKR